MPSKLLSPHTHAHILRPTFTTEFSALDGQHKVVSDAADLTMELATTTHATTAHSHLARTHTHNRLTAVGLGLPEETLTHSRPS